MACEFNNLGSFEYCDCVNVSEFIDGPVDVLFLQTSRNCTFQNGDFGQLETGQYVFAFQDTNYEFSVV